MEGAEERAEGGVHIRTERTERGHSKGWIGGEGSLF